MGNITYYEEQNILKGNYPSKREEVSGKEALQKGVKQKINNQILKKLDKRNDFI